MFNISTTMAPLHLWIKVLDGINKERDNFLMLRWSNKNNYTYSAIHKIVKDMKKLGWITMVKQSRNVIIKITADGIPFANSCTTMVELVKKIKED